MGPCLPADVWIAPVAPGSSPRSRPSRSPWPTASRSCTASGPATRTGTRRSGRPTSSAWPTRRSRSRSSDGLRAARLVHARRPGRAAGRRPRARLGVRPRPHDPPRPGPPRGRVPRADVRRARQRRERTRDAPDVGRRIRGGRPGRRRRAPPASRGHAHRAARALDGCGGIARGGGRGPGRRRRHRGRGAGRPVPPHAPDLPARAPADPGAHRLAARVADDARLPAAARPHRRIGQRDGRGPVDRAPGDAGPRLRRRGRPGLGPRAPRRRAPDRPPRTP